MAGLSSAITATCNQPSIMYGVDGGNPDISMANYQTYRCMSDLSGYACCSNSNGDYGVCSGAPFNVCTIGGAACANSGICSESGVATSGNYCCYCPSGTYSSALSSTGNPAGVLTSSSGCYACPIGSYSGGPDSNLYSIGNGACLACSPGYYADATGSSQCMACPILRIGAFKSCRKL